MSYDFLTTIVVINAIVTFILLQKVVNKPARPRLKKKSAKKLWRSEPIVPRHDPPKVLGDDFCGQRTGFSLPTSKALPIT